MGKAKKGKKGTRDDESDEEIEVETPVGADENLAGKSKEKKIKSKIVDETPEDDEDELSTKKKKGKKDKKKKRDEDDVESAPDEDEETPVAKVKSSKKQVKKVEKFKATESSDEELVPRSKTSKNKNPRKSDDDSDDENIRPSKPIQSNKNKSFALLMADSNSNSEDEEQSDDNKKSRKKKVVKSDSLEDEFNCAKTKDDKVSSKKGKKGKKKKEDDDEEDIEKMLAELALEYSGGKKEEPVVVVEEARVEPAKKVKTKGKESIKDSIVTEVEKVEIIDGVELEGTIKSAAQKKKEKKEREKLKKQAQKKQEPLKKQNSTEGDVANDDVVQDEKIKSTDDVSIEPNVSEDPEMEDKKKKKKKGKDVEEEKGKAKGPNKKMIAAMQEALKKVKEEEEKFAREEEERIRREEEAEKARDEAIRLEQERKEKRKQKEKEKKERLKAEGKLLTAKQKNDRARAQAMLDALKAQGLDMPNIGEKKAPRPGTRVRGKSKVQTNVEEKEVEGENVGLQLDDHKVEVEIVDQEKDEEKGDLKEMEEEEVEGVKDAWDAESSGGEHEEEEEEDDTISETPVKAATHSHPKSPAKGREKNIKQKQSSQEDEDDDDDSGSSSEEDSDDSEEEHKTDAEKKREKALARISKRRQEAEKGKTLDNLRAAVVCVLGHVDTGKTKILDKLRRTNVQDGEAGGITQQIGATNVPIDAIKEQTKIVKGFADYVMRIPGLLIIDTPGHESFSNLRSRGSSLCDIAILVVDIMHGIEPQTLESLNLLKSKKTPFVVALNKIDRLYDWQTMARKDVRDVIKAQASNTQLEFEQRTKEVIVQFAEQGLNASLFYENPDIRSYVSLVPTSAITGEGIPNLLALIVDNCQNMLAKRLMYSDELQATVLEVKAISGLGTTIDAILINGKLREGDTMVLAGTDGPIVTQIRSLLMPQPMKELRVKNAYVEYKEIKAAQGVKIAAKELEKAIAGLNMQVAQKPDEVEILREEVAKELRQALSNIKLKDRGVYVQASTLGSLEALLEFLKTSNIPYSNIRIGPVVKKDVMKASTMLEHDSQYATILAFDVKVEKDAQEMADTLGVRIFQADIIYHLFDKFMAYREELRQRKREEFKHIAVFPCKLKVLPQYIFNSRDPIVMGVMIEAGIVREGTPICVPSQEFVELGVIRSVEYNKKSVENARKGQEVCIKIEAIPGEAPKMFGRHFDEKDFLVSKISRQSIDACKDYFRDDLIKADWELMVELKKLFEIL